MSGYPLGERWLFELGFADVVHEMVDETTMRFHILTGPRAGIRGEVAAAIDRVASDQFLVSWQEADGHNVVHFEDFVERRFRAFVSMPDGTLLCLAGAIRPD